MVWIPEESSQTFQEFKDEEDINILVTFYKQTVTSSDTYSTETYPSRVSIFRDVSEIHDSTSILEIINRGKASHAGFPSNNKSVFSDSPDVFLMLS